MYLCSVIFKFKSMKPFVYTDNGNITVYNNSIKEIEEKIFTFRGIQVMIDKDLADVYGVKTKALNQAVKRNVERFPERYRFQLFDNELDELVTKCDRLQILKHSSSNPYAFTEQGVSMLSSVLKSDTAVQTSIKIIDAFVAMRHFMLSNAKLFTEIDNLKQHQIETDVHLLENDKKIDQILTLLDKNNEEDKQRLFFDGQIYDAFSFMVSIVKKAIKDIILIDNYVNVETLDILSKKNELVNVQIITSKNTKLTQYDIDKFISQYPTLTLNFTDKFHDRFFIIDHSSAYHIGASIKDAGKKCFGVNLINDEWLVKMLLRKISDII